MTEVKLSAVEDGTGNHHYLILKLTSYKCYGHLLPVFDRLGNKVLERDSGYADQATAITNKVVHELLPSNRGVLIHLSILLHVSTSEKAEDGHIKVLFS
jgi:hypothetical protein